MAALGFPAAKMSESIGDNPNWRLSHAGIVAGDFAHHPGITVIRAQIPFCTGANDLAMRVMHRDIGMRHNLKDSRVTVISVSHRN